MKVLIDAQFEKATKTFESMKFVPGDLIRINNSVSLWSTELLVDEKTITGCEQVNDCLLF